MEISPRAAAAAAAGAVGEPSWPARSFPRPSLFLLNSFGSQTKKWRGGGSGGGEEFEPGGGGSEKGWRRIAFLVAFPP